MRTITVHIVLVLLLIKCAGTVENDQKDFGEKLQSIEKQRNQTLEYYQHLDSQYQVLTDSTKTNRKIMRLMFLGNRYMSMVLPDGKALIEDAYAESEFKFKDFKEYQRFTDLFYSELYLLSPKCTLDLKKVIPSSGYIDLQECETKTEKQEELIRLGKMMVEYEMEVLKELERKIRE